MSIRSTHLARMEGSDNSPKLGRSCSVTDRLHDRSPVLIEDVGYCWAISAFWTFSSALWPPSSHRQILYNSYLRCRLSGAIFFLSKVLVFMVKMSMRKIFQL